MPHDAHVCFCSHSHFHSAGGSLHVLCSSKTTDSSTKETRGLVFVGASDIYGPGNLPIGVLPQGMDDGLPVLPFPGPCTGTTAVEGGAMSSQASTSGGLSGGAATGLAIVMLCIGGLAGAVVMIWWNQRQQQQRQRSGYMGDMHQSYASSESEQVGLRTYQGVQIKGSANV
jgi:hypothetical protein